MHLNTTASLCEEGEEIPEDELDFVEQRKLIEWIAYRVIGPAVVATGLLGNILNLIVLTRPSLRGVTYTYLIGLASADLGVLLCAIPMIVRQTEFEGQSSWAVAFFYSKLEHPLANAFMASSIFIVICLTVDRFASVCLPTRFKSLHTAANSHAAILTCYLIAILISLPLTLLKHVLPCPSHNTSTPLYTFTEDFSITQHAAWKAYLITAEVVVRFGPAAVLAVLNVCIILRFRHISQKRREILQGGGDMAGNDQLLLRGEKISKKIYKEEKRLFTLLSAIVVLFFVTTTPAAFLSIFYSQTLDKNLTFQVFRAVANCLELCNFALNFYIYFLCSKDFRKKFLSFFKPTPPTPL